MSYVRRAVEGIVIAVDLLALAGLVVVGLLGVTACLVSVASQYVPATEGTGLTLRATPAFLVRPGEVMLTGRLSGDESEELWCPEVEWLYGDGSSSSNQSDCGPYESGVGIQRVFTVIHPYRTRGVFPARLNLKRHGRTVVAGTVNVQVGSDEE